MRYIYSLLFLVFGTASAYVIHTANDCILFYLAGGVYGISTVLFLPALVSVSISLVRNMVLRLVWIISTAVSYYLAVQTFLLLYSMTGEDENIFYFMLAGVIGAMVVVGAYAFIAYSAGRALRWAVLFMVPVVGGIIPLLVLHSFSEFFPALHYVWQLSISALLIISTKGKKAVFVFFR